MPRDFSEEINIDRYNLEKECAENGERVIHWGGKWAEAETEKERAKKRLDEIRAVLDIRIRKNPGDFGLEKITEGALSSLISTQTEYVQANEEYIDERDMAMKLNLVKEAFLQRKDLLLAEIKLFLNFCSKYEDRVDFNSDKAFRDRVRMKRKMKGEGV